MATWQDIVDGGWESQGFGPTDYSAEWIAPWAQPGGHIHCGIDIACAFRTPVRTTRAGIVVAVGIQYLGDQAVGIRNDPIPFAGEGVTYAEYGHCDQALVRLGDRVRPGQVIALADSRGASSGNHVHLEVRTDGAVQGIANHGAALVDPTPYLKVKEALMNQAEKNEKTRNMFLAGLYRQPDPAAYEAYRVAIADDASNIEVLAQQIYDSGEAQEKRAALEALFADGGRIFHQTPAAAPAAMPSRTYTLTGPITIQ